MKKRQHKLLLGNHTRNIYILNLVFTWRTFILCVKKNLLRNIIDFLQRLPELHRVDSSPGIVTVRDHKQIKSANSFNLLEECLQLHILTF